MPCARVPATVFIVVFLFPPVTHSEGRLVQQTNFEVCLFGHGFQIQRWNYIWQYPFKFNHTDGHKVRTFFGKKKRDLYIWPGSYSYELEALKLTTVRTQIYSISMQHFIYRICSCPCTHSHLEPLVWSCMHTYIHKYTCIISSLLLYMNRCCANSHMSLPSRTHILRTSLYNYTFIHKYTYSVW
jgi:hypothetical protein